MTNRAYAAEACELTPIQFEPADRALEDERLTAFCAAKPLAPRTDSKRLALVDTEVSGLTPRGSFGTIPFVLPKQVGEQYGGQCLEACRIRHAGPAPRIATDELASIVASLSGATFRGYCVARSMALGER